LFCTLKRLRLMSLLDRWSTFLRIELPSFFSSNNDRRCSFTFLPSLRTTKSLSFFLLAMRRTHFFFHGKEALVFLITNAGQPFPFFLTVVNYSNSPPPFEIFRLPASQRNRLKMVDGPTHIIFFYSHRWSVFFPPGLTI